MSVPGMALVGNVLIIAIRVGLGRGFQRGNGEFV